MRYRNRELSAVLLGVVLSLLITSPVLAGDAFSDLFSQTKICFSHVAITDGWETEVAVVNPTAKRVGGNLTFYGMEGNQLGAAVPVTINSHGRYQVEVGTTFANRGNIEYMIFTASTYGLKGYSKFYKGGVRASIVASAPQTTGLFTKLDHEGWTGIAFVNMGSSVAHIILTAYSDAGQAVAVKPMDVGPGAKVVKTAEKLFAPQSISSASYVSFDSDQGVVGFFLNGSSDGTKLDGSKAL